MALRSAAGLLVAAVLLLVPVAASAQLRVLRVHSDPGKVTVVTAVDNDAALDAAIGATPSKADFNLWLQGGGAPGGAANDLTVTRNGQGSYATVIALDNSGSYKRDAAAALQTIDAYLKDLNAAEPLGLIEFGVDATPMPVTNAASLHAQAAGLHQTIDRTNLLAAIQAAVALAKDKGKQPYLREVVIFTDGGDEAHPTQAQWDDAIHKAAESATRVSVVVIKPDKRADMTAVNGLRKLAEETRGAYINDGTPAEVAAGLARSRQSARGWLIVEGKLCGLPSGGASPEAWVEFVKGHKSSDHKSFSPSWKPESAEKCHLMAAAAVLTCTPDCDSGWQQCSAGKCVGKPCSGDEQCNGMRCDPTQKVCVTVARGSLLDSWWLWALAGAGALMLILGVVLLTRKKKEPEPAIVAPPIEPPKVEPPPKTEIEEPKAPAATVGAVASGLNPLPETHLCAIGGNLTVGEKWRLHKPKMWVGGSSDPKDANDIVFGVPKVSGKHAVFELFPSGDLWVTDLASRNGTFVNGKQLAAKERMKLRPGDQVKLSHQIILQVLRPGFEATPPSDDKAAADTGSAAAGDAAPAEKGVFDKKKTRFDPGNR